MDPLTDFLDGPRARNAFLLQVKMSPPWSIKVEDDAPLTVVAMLRGTAYFRQRNCDPILLEPGALLLIRDPSAYVLADQPDGKPSYFIGIDQNCSGSNGEDLAQDLRTGLRTWGNDAAGPDAMLVGTYRSSGEVGDLLLSSLPPHVLIQQAENPIVAVLMEEIDRDGVAQASVLDRLLDLLLIGAVRSWTAQVPNAEHNWLTAERDPAVQQAIRLIHSSPDMPWTVESLAGRVGVSRASLARRFHERVGKPPMAYLNHWRLAKAADLMADERLTLTTISRQVGYASPFSFSTSFKKRYGVSPQEYRRRQPATGVAAPLGG
ncbi:MULTISPECIES: AraC family transcriptional regulator [Micrococcaceae]|jgi:AraC-like DNA-binding protein|uniref:AraC family transcriptional regulator n=1 Tax=Micrococcaceae TaxID=1268 RepID=UPI000C9E8036|nr:AraC family transcriptional regulator [Arthrobacter sp. AFG7.2]MDV2979903.1 AraC family transcriptional regulator [Actinomycetes bacterium ARC8]PNI08209.1 AraC family transcriptional regulator [Arthrobacter sp. AFG7.2]